MAAVIAGLLVTTGLAAVVWHQSTGQNPQEATGLPGATPGSSARSAQPAPTESVDADVGAEKNLTATIGRPEDLDQLLEFAREHVQTVVLLDLTFVAPDSGTLAVQPDVSGVAFIADQSGGCNLCGVDVGIEDLERAPDASLSQTGGVARLTGRFLIQFVDVGTGGIVSIALRAVRPGEGADDAVDPAITASPQPGSASAVGPECDVQNFGLSEYPGDPLSTQTGGNQPIEVRALQDWLNYLGYGCLQEDGVFGGSTKTAVVAYQADERLTADGVVGADTWQQLTADILDYE